MPKTVLLADDNITIQRVVELTFANEDVKVVSVPDGDRAIESIRRGAPDLVLADIAMPGRSGYEVAEFVRSQPQLAAVPVLLLAGAFEPADPGHAQQVGADGILIKPFDPAVLVARVNELLTVGRGGPSNVVAHPPSLRPVDLIGRTPPAPPAMQPAEPASAEDRPVEESDRAAERETPQAAASSPKSEADRYFDEVDQAFAALSKVPRPPLTPAPEGQASLSDPQTPEVRSEPATSREQTPPPAAQVYPVPLTDAFTALLDAERGDTEGVARLVPPPPPPSTPPSIDVDALADEIARRVLAQLSDRVVRETVAEIVSATAERVVREEIERIKRHIK